ncbi:protein kinase [Streptomyces sp. W16]|uniref:protein kinase domain-containing protein n=1 Tax=Streptomyces sp. W16 TaxID=3076631 RepID=UPI00295B88B1|nr:protein kinase [Streptomyces sp. W16]MDV9169639.1 protein kinase [Streptomyces sp. W16]
MTPSPANGITDLLLAELTGGNAQAATEQLLGNTDELELTVATVSILRDILDHITNYEFEQSSGSSFADSCKAARQRLRSHPAAPAVGFVSLICLNVVLLERRFKSPDASEQRRADAYCRLMFRTPGIGRAIELVYGPVGHPSTTPTESGFWSQIDFASLRYHKAGTTSFILRGTRKTPDNEAGSYSPLAVKCVLFPWNKLAAIARATDLYAERYGRSTVSERVVKPEASSGQWVLMPFQNGRTLGELLTEFEAGRPSMADRIGMAEDIAHKLTTALHKLAHTAAVDVSDPSCQHLDLSPNNVIIDDEGIAKFIDLGINHLYSRQVGIAEHDDAVYIAPEIKNKRNASPTADAYSLGIILMQILAGAPPRDGRTPESIWTASPNLGRLLEDFIEERPENRILLLAHDTGFRFDALRDHLGFFFDLVRQEPIAQPGEYQYVLARIAPASREAWTQFQQWLHLRNNGHSHISGRNERYLLFFSALSTFGWWFIVSKTALVTVGDTVTGKAEALPAGLELYAKVIALSQGLVAAKFYQTILARLTVSGIPGPRARLAEVSMRTMSVVAVPTTALSTFSPGLYWVWPWTCAGGAVAVALSNWTTWHTANRLLDDAEQELSTAPAPDRRFARGYEQWWWTMLLYALIIVIIGWGIQIGALKDLAAYVFILVTITVGVHYGSKCAAAGPAICGSIARAFFAGQRLEILRRRGQAP